MGFVDWANAGVKKMDVWDIGLTKWAVLFFTILIVKWWPALTALDWYWYALFGVAAAFRPLKRFISK